jgi:beta-glucosidase/6-phospho-beta-glucosidase/beta-galactosidase
MPIASRCVDWCNNDLSVCVHPSITFNATWADIGMANIQNASITNATVSGSLIVETCVKANNTWFPADFKWGFSNAAYQVEAETPLADFYHVTQSLLYNPVGEPGLSNDFLNTYNASFDRAAATGSNAFRMSLAWHRIHTRGVNNSNTTCPVGSTYVVDRGCFDFAAIALYVKIVNSARARGLDVFLTLFHLVMPNWIATLYGEWRGPCGCITTAPDSEGCGPCVYEFGQTDGILLHPADAVAIYKNYITVVIPYFVNIVSNFYTMNEPRNQAFGYFTGIWSPGMLAMTAAPYLRAFDSLMLMNAAGYDHIHAVYSAASKSVKVSFNDNFYMLQTTEMGSTRDRQFQEDWNAFQRLPWDAAIHGLTYDTDLITPITYAAKYPLLTAGWNACESDSNTSYKIDFMSLSAYGTFNVPAIGTCDFENGVPFYYPTSSSFERGLFTQAYCPASNPRGVKRQFGTEISTYIYDTLQKLSLNYGLPIFIAEHGYYTSAYGNGDYDEPIADVIRTRGTLHTLNGIRRAVVDGINVIGYTHWTLEDNYEWFATYTQRFGMYKTGGRGTSNLTFTPRSTVAAYTSLLGTGCIPNVRLDKVEIGDTFWGPQCPYPGNGAIPYKKTDIVPVASQKADYLKAAIAAHAANTTISTIPPSNKKK